MKAARLLCSLSLLAGLSAHTAGAAGEADVQKLQGRWQLAPEAREVVAANCQSLTYEIDASTITTRSGALVFVTRYEVETPGPEFVLLRTVVSNNSERNCYGVVLPYVAGQRAGKMRIDLMGERLRIHEPPHRGGDRSFEMVRSTK